MPPLGPAGPRCRCSGRVDLRVVDENTEPLRDEALRWADVVPQRDETSTRPLCHAIPRAGGSAWESGRVVGRTAVNTAAGSSPDADHLFRG